MTALSKRGAWFLSMAVGLPSVCSAGATDLAAGTSGGVAVQDRGAVSVAELGQTLERHGWSVQTAPDGSTLYWPPRPEREAALPAPRPDALAKHLRERLEDRGWRAVPAPGDGVYYLPPLPAPALGEGIADRLERALEAQGWVKQQTDDGSVVYRRPPARQEPVETAASPATALADRLRQTLTNQGWRAEPKADGSIDYSPPTPETSPQPNLAERLRGALEARGWRGEMAEQGNIIYRAPNPAARGVDGTDDLPGEPFTERLRQALQSSGWQTRAADDGGVILFKSPVPSLPNAPDRDEAPEQTSPGTTETVPIGPEARSPTQAPLDSEAPACGRRVGRPCHRRAVPYAHSGPWRGSPHQAGTATGAPPVSFR